MNLTACPRCTRLYGPDVTACPVCTSDYPSRAAQERLVFDSLRREGLVDAILEVVAVLNGNGLEKHGVQRWRGVANSVHREKSRGHGERDGREAESGRLHRAHKITRDLILTQIELETERLGKDVSK